MFLIFLFIPPYMFQVFKLIVIQKNDPHTQMQALLFMIFLILYLLTVLENLIIITLIRRNHQLHKPMHFSTINFS